MTRGPQSIAQMGLVNRVTVVAATRPVVRPVILRVSMLSGGTGADLGLQPTIGTTTGFHVLSRVEVPSRVALECAIELMLVNANNDVVVIPGPDSKSRFAQIQLFENPQSRGFLLRQEATLTSGDNAIEKRMACAVRLKTCTCQTSWSNCMRPAETTAYVSRDRSRSVMETILVLAGTIPLASQVAA